MFANIIAFVGVKKQLETLLTKVGACEPHHIGAVDSRIAKAKHILPICILQSNTLKISDHQKAPGALMGPMCKSLQNCSIVGCVDIAPVVRIPNPLPFKHLLHVEVLHSGSTTNFQGSHLRELYLLDVLEIGCPVTMSR
jgi:hypothetical protein